MRQLLHGAIAMGGFSAGLFFLRFYRDRRDALFAYFGAAFWLIAASNATLGLSDAEAETRVYVYLLRLLAFLLIIVAIIGKNRARS